MGNYETTTSHGLRVQLSSALAPPARQSGLLPYPRNSLDLIFSSSRSCLQVVEDPGANALGGGADEGTFVDAINPNAPNIKVGACS